MSSGGFEPGYGLRVVMTRTALKKAVLDEISSTLDQASTLHSPDEAWDAITSAAKDMIAAQDEWAAYIERKRAEKFGIHVLAAWVEDSSDKGGQQ